MFEVELSAEAKDLYADVEQSMARKLARCFAQLEQEPRRHNNIKRLGSDLAGCWRYRVGDWRVIYRIDDQARRILVLFIAHRREVYD
jgi:mRNA interferase RelE/StbE